MKIIKKSSKVLVISSLLLLSAAISNAQDYYGGGGGESWRKQPANNKPQQPNDKDNGIAEPSGYLSINFGFAIPEGNFSQAFPQGSYSEAIGVGYGNYAQSGTAFHFSLGFPINHSNFGIAFMFGSYNNDYNLNSYVNTLANSNSGNPYSNSPIIGYSAVLPSQNFYSESSILGGLFVTYPFGRLSIDGRLMMGVLLNSLPEQDVYAVDADNDLLEYDVQPSIPTSFAIDAGVGARFLIAQLGRRKLCAMINLDFLYSHVSYNTEQYITVTPSSGTYAGTPVSLEPTPAVSGSLPIELLNVTFGIGYQL